MVGELQHERWRRDIAANIEKARKEIDLQELSDTGARIELALQTNEVIAKVMLAERLGELSRTMIERDQLVIDLETKGRKADSLLLRVLPKTDTDSTLAWEIRQHLSDNPEVDQRAGKIDPESEFDQEG